MVSTSGRVLAAGVLLVGASGLSGCGLLSGSSDLEEALEYLPADATSVTFVNRAKVMERLDLEDVDADASDEAMKDYLKTLADEQPSLTRLDTYAAVMRGKAEFSAFDVEWEATATGGDQQVVVWKLDDDVDFEKVADDLEDAGFERAGDDDQPTFTADLSAVDNSTLIGDRYPVDMLNSALIPDEHLIIASHAEAGVDVGLDVANDDADSLADEGSFDDLLDRAPDQDGLEFAALTIARPCDGSRLSASQLEALRAEAGSVGQPDELGLYVHPDEPVTVARLFDEDDDAESEAADLADFLDESGERTGLDVDFDVEQDDKAVLVEADFADQRRVIQAWQQRDGPFTCLPSS